MSVRPTLLSPIKVGHLTLPNRTVMGSMHVGLEDQVGPLNKLGAYLARRAEGGAALLVTGGVAPNIAGWVKPLSARLTNRWEAYKHRAVTDAVHAANGRVIMQILHAGRYGYHPFCVSASAVKSPISPFKPKALTDDGVEDTIRDFARCARLAKEAGYDGVEIMGSEGYLIHQFIAARTNHRTDRWGGTAQQRMRFPLAIVRAVRDAVGHDFVIMFRLSMLDLVQEGATWDEVVELAVRLEAEGVDVLNTGIGWHEARVPTIATSVPRAAFTWVTHRLRPHVKIPLVTSNRINMPSVAEQVLADGHADLVSMARPFLADPDWVKKAAAGKDDEINTCIACNQACLDHIFQNRRVSCLVNPLACAETELVVRPTVTPRKVAVVGAGPAGLACSTTLAERGHHVTLFEAADELGGQFNLAKRIPGKEEFQETIRYFKKRIEVTGVELRLSTRASVDALVGFDDVVLASGVHPRRVKFPGSDHPKVVSYVDAIRNPSRVGPRAALLGAGGIGFDVAELLAHAPSSSDELTAYQQLWGIDPTLTARGGLVPPTEHPPARKLWLCQRTPGKLGMKLGKTTGWIHRAAVDKADVEQLSEVEYLKVDDAGLHVRVAGSVRLLPVDTVVVCAGQEPNRDLEPELSARGITVRRIGGADVAADLDAKRAIDQGTRLALTI